MKKSITSLRRKADRLFQEKYTKGNCLVCGKPANCVHHYIPKGRSNYLRYSEHNAIPICRGCHTKHHLSGDPAIIHAIDRQLDPMTINYLEGHRQVICKFTIGYLEGIIEQLSN